MGRISCLGMSDEGPEAPYEAGPGISWEMRSVELFTGAGGLALGLERAGFRSSLMVEWDDHAYATIKANSDVGGPTSRWPLRHCDVRDVGFDALGEVDLVAGGPPCQPFSIAGKHRGYNDPRDMWPHAIRAVREACPRAFLFENVRGLARASFSTYLQYIVERLRRPMVVIKTRESWHEHLARLLRVNLADGDGPTYRVGVHKINAADYGAPQKRHRVVIVGRRNDLDLDWQFPSPTHSQEALLWEQFVTGEYWNRHGISRPSRIEKEPRLAFGLGSDRPKLKPWVTVRDAVADLPEPTTDGKGVIGNHKFQPGARVYAGHTGSALDEPAKALKAGDHGVPGGENMMVLANGSVRYFTVRESARLQGFPDNFVFPGSWTESMRQLGNAVPVPMATAIARSLAEAMRAKRSKSRRRAA
jgi:DNA (cytosine-5)-methyltransferase 1